MYITLVATANEPSKLETFFKDFKQLEFKKGETILRPDGDVRDVFYINKGFVRLHTFSNEGKELTAIILKRGEVFPLSILVTGSTNIYWYEAIAQTQVYKAPADQFREFLIKEPDAFFSITNELLVHLGGLIYRMQHIILGKANTTVASIILIYSKLMGVKKGDDIMLQLPVTHEQISFSAGITRETASLEIKKLERKGIIKYKGRRLVIVDLKSLEEESYIGGW